MSVSINIKIKFVLLMTKFESPIVLKLKLHVQFGKNAPSENCIIVRSQRFCETVTVRSFVKKKVFMNVSAF